jgi:hypothetical protein
MLRTTPLRRSSKSPTAKLKERIQALVRAIVIKRDNGCLLKGFNGVACNPVLQADHLITRGKNIGFADTRLIVCLCKGHHTAKTYDTTGIYEAAIRERIAPERRTLWDRARADQKSYPMSAYDWAKEALALEHELGQMI